MNDEELYELIPLVALHALPADELDDAEAAIGSDPLMRAELDQMRALVASLDDASDVTPPPDLRQRILDIVAVTPQLDHAPPEAKRPELTIVEGTAHSGPLPQATAPRRPRSQWLGLSAAAAVCALVAGMVAWFALGGSPSESEQIAEVMDSSVAQTVMLDDGRVQGIRIVYSPTTGDAVLVGEGLPEPGDDRDYQLWYVEGTSPVSAGVFRPDDDGSVEQLIEDFEVDGNEFAVTEEPAGGSEAPTSDPIATSF